MNSPRTAQILICVVDPSSDDYKSLSEMLGHDGVAIEMAATSAAALRRRAGGLPDIWVVNMRLPDMAGCDLVPLLHEQYPGAPVCLVSDEYHADDEILARCAGAEMYFAKPVHPCWLTAVTALCETMSPDRLDRTLASTSSPIEFSAVNHDSTVSIPITSPC